MARAVRAVTRLALLLAAMGALFLLGRRLEPRAVPAPIDDVDWMAEWHDGPYIHIPMPTRAATTHSSWAAPLDLCYCPFVGKHAGDHHCDTNPPVRTPPYLTAAEWRN